ncbi:hypothetical protein CHLRE_16g685725v5 [Chlamydomonas reinhardtii]|uniref:SET domain-containing protein n=1 Tax=Chlamydomonas reinhardtii TaxID=3055 RepID=A0A2K3CW36_CHLRE|nr:uncharacterized protein CHLRE_16g685725v5 [Chlamydomonas reinhardtii]PNW72493.1 hypothetical protein CHLRE_16g685725v5 [Chlamydomonas reinhardtii]
MEAPAAAIHQRAASDWMVVQGKLPLGISASAGQAAAGTQRLILALLAPHGAQDLLLKTEAQGGRVVSYPVQLQDGGPGGRFYEARLTSQLPAGKRPNWTLEGLAQWMAHNKVQRGTVVTVSVDPGSRHPTISAAALGSTAAEASVPAAPESPRQQSSAPQANKAQHQQAQSQRSGGAAATASASAAPSSSHHNGSSHGGIGDEGGGGEGGGDGADSELPLRNTTVAQTCRMDLTAYLLRRHILSFSRETGRAFFHHMRTNVDFDVYVWIDGRAAPFDCVLRSYDYSSKQEQATGGEGGGSGGSSTWVLRRVAPVLQALNAKAGDVLSISQLGDGSLALAVAQTGAAGAAGEEVNDEANERAQESGDDDDSDDNDEDDDVGNEDEVLDEAEAEQPSAEEQEDERRGAPAGGGVAPKRTAAPQQDTTAGATAEASGPPGQPSLPELDPSAGKMLTAVDLYASKLRLPAAMVGASGVLAPLAAAVARDGAAHGAAVGLVLGDSVGGSGPDTCMVKVYRYGGRLSLSGARRVMTGLETALGAPPQAGDVLLLQPLPHEWAGLSPAQAVAAGKYRLRAGLLRASPAAATAAAHVPAKLQRAPPPGAVAAVAVAPVPVALQHPVSAAQPQTSISDSGGWSEGVMGRGGGDVGACGSGAQGTTAAAMGAVAPPPGAGGSNADGSRGPHRPGGWGPLTRPPLPPPHATRPPPSMHIKEEPGRGDGRRCNPAADSDAPSPRTAAPGLGRSANPQHPPASSRPAACIIHLHGWVSEGATPHLSPAPLPDELQLCGLTFHPTLVPAVRAAMQRWADALTCPLSSADPAKQQMRFLGIDPPPSSSASTPSAGAAAGGPGAGPGKMWPPWRYAFQKAGVSRNLVASRLALLLGLSGESGCADAPLPAAAPAWTVRTRAVHPGGRGEVAGGGQEGEGGDGGGGPSLAACGGGGVFAAEPIRKSAVLGLLGGYVLPAADRTACLGYQSCSSDTKERLAQRLRAAGCGQLPTGALAHAWSFLAHSLTFPHYLQPELPPYTPAAAAELDSRWNCGDLPEEQRGPPPPAELCMLGGYGCMSAGGRSNPGALINDPRSQPRDFGEHAGTSDIDDLPAATQAANVLVLPVCVRGLVLPVLVATRNIKPGEQLLRDYGAAWWRRLTDVWELLEDEQIAPEQVLWGAADGAAAEAAADGAGASEPVPPAAAAAAAAVTTTAAAPEAGAGQSEQAHAAAQDLPQPAVLGAEVAADAAAGAAAATAGSSGAPGPPEASGRQAVGRAGVSSGSTGTAKHTAAEVAKERRPERERERDKGRSHAKSGESDRERGRQRREDDGSRERRDSRDRQRDSRDRERSRERERGRDRGRDRERRSDGDRDRDRSRTRSPGRDRSLERASGRSRDGEREQGRDWERGRERSRGRGEAREGSRHRQDGEPAAGRPQPGRSSSPHGGRSPPGGGGGSGAAGGDAKRPRLDGPPGPAGAWRRPRPFDEQLVDDDRLNGPPVSFPGLRGWRDYDTDGGGGMWEPRHIEDARGPSGVSGEFGGWAPPPLRPPQHRPPPPQYGPALTQWRERW